MKADIRSMTMEELEHWVAGLSLPKFRAKQIFAWLQKGVSSFEEMKNISAADQRLLAVHAFLAVPRIAQKQVSKLDGTIKYLFELEDGQMIESVLMQYEHGTSLCVSSQAGCRMGCSFCASTLGGLSRNLTPAELLNQVVFAQKDSGKRIGHIVLMGIGEPLDNFDHVIKFLQLVNDKNGLNIGMRNLSLSTCGLVDEIYRLADLGLQLTLSISLHAPSDEIRDTIMPVNRKYPIDVLLKACYDYFVKTGRRISVEYTLIDGVNNSEECALLLAKKIKPLRCHVNLIEVNDVRERGYHGSREKTQGFLRVLKEQNINATLRRKLGRDIDASCGQLRAKHSDGEEST